MTLTSTNLRILALLMVFSAASVMGAGIALGSGSLIFLAFLGAGFLILALISPQWALIFSIPLQLSGALGVLSGAEEFQLYGLNLQSITMLVLFGAVLVRKVSSGEKWRTSSLDLPLALFFFGVYTLWSFWDRGSFVIPDYAHLAALKGIIFLVLNYFIALNSGIDERWLKRMLAVTMLTAVIISLRDLLIYIQAGGLSSSLDWRTIRLAETMGLPIIGGNTLLQGLFFAVAFSQAFSAPRSQRVFWGALALLFLVDVLLSFYRSAFLMVVASTATIVLLVKGKRGMPLLIIIAITAAVLLPSAIIDRILYTFDTPTEQLGELQVNLTGRASYHWPRSIGVAFRYFPLGVGHLQLPIARGDGYTAFNQFLNWFAEFGLIGLLAALWMTVSIIRYLWNASHTPSSGFLRAFFVGLLSAWISILVRNMTGEGFPYIWLGLFMMLLGAGASALTLESPSQRKLSTHE